MDVTVYPFFLSIIFTKLFIFTFVFVQPLLWANNQITLSSQRLSKIIEMEHRFFDLSKGARKPSDQELTRKALVIKVEQPPIVRSLGHAAQ